MKHAVRRRVRPQPVPRPQADRSTATRPPTSTAPAARRRRSACSTPSPTTSSTTTPTPTAPSRPARRPTHDRRRRPWRGADFLGCDCGRGQLRRQHDDPHPPARAGARARACSPATRSLITAARPRGQPRPLAAARRARRRGPRGARRPGHVHARLGRLRGARRRAHARSIAVGYASNAVGTVNDVARAAALAREAGALQRRRRRALRPARADRRARRRLRLPALLGLQVLRPARGHHVRAPRGHERCRAAPPAHQEHATRRSSWETGTLNHEGMAGAGRGHRVHRRPRRRHHERSSRTRRRRRPAAAGAAAIVAGMLAAEAYEQPLAQRLRRAARAASPA